MSERKTEEVAGGSTSTVEPEQFREMVTEPRYTCEFCGRTAREAHNLCYPKPL